MSSDWRSRLLRNSVWLSVGLLLGRLLGFGRDWIIASSYGATQEADIAVVLLTFPDFLINILVGGALSYTLIPEFSRQASSNRDGALFTQTSLLVFVVFAMMALLFTVNAELLTTLIAPGFSVELTSRTADYLSIALWVIPLTTLAGVSTAYLQSREQFAVPSLGTFIFNLVLVIGLTVGYGQLNTITWLPWLILVAAGLRWFSQILRVRSLIGTPWRKEWLLSKRLLVHYMHTVAAVGVLLMLPLIARAYASLGEPGSVMIINLALRLVEFPLGVAVTVFAVGMFPAISRALNTQEGDADKIIGITLERVLYISIAIAIPLCWFGSGLAQFVFGWGNLQPAQAHQVGQLFSIAALSLPLQGVSQVLLTVMNARQDTRVMVLISIIAVFFFSTTAWLLLERYSLFGIAAMLVTTYLMVVLMQGYEISRRHGLQVFSILADIIWRRDFMAMLVGGNVMAWILLTLTESHWVEAAAAPLIGIVLLALVHRNRPHLLGRTCAGIKNA